MAKRKLKSGADAHEFTTEDAAKGGRARAESFQERRQAAEQAADERLVSGLAKALERLEGMLESKNEQVAFRAITVYLDRALGKAALQAGRQDVTRSEAVEIVRQERATKMDAEIPAARAMLARLIVRRQLDRDKRSALWRLLTDIADHPPEKRLGGDRRPSQEHNGLGLLTRRRAGRRDRYLARNGYAAQQIQGPVDRERRDNCAAY